MNFKTFPELENHFENSRVAEINFGPKSEIQLKLFELIWIGNSGVEKDLETIIRFGNVSNFQELKNLCFRY